MLSAALVIQSLPKSLTRTSRKLNVCTAFRTGFVLVLKFCGLRGHELGFERTSLTIPAFLCGWSMQFQILRRYSAGGAR
jgi:hypothetical protein